MVIVFSYLLKGKNCASKIFFINDDKNSWEL